MDIKTFVQETLHQIIDAVEEVRMYGYDHGAEIPERYSDSTYYAGESGQSRYKVHLVEFEIGLKTETEKGGKAGLSVDFGSVKIDGDGGINKGNTSASKVKFSIPIIYYNKSISE